ncbi:MAG: oligosaccharide flippase family protein [Candidatus Dormibacter sp.]
MPRPSLRQGSLLNFGEGAISLAAALVVSVLLAHQLHPDGFGLYALVMSIVSFAYLFARAGIPGTVRRYAAEFDGRGERDLIGIVAGRGLRNSILTGVAAALLLAALAGPLSSFFNHAALRSYLLIGSVLLIPMVPLSVLRALLGGLQHYRYLMRVSLVTSPLWLAACAIALYAKAGIAGVLVATLIVELVNLGALGVRAMRDVHITWSGAVPESIKIRLQRYNLALAALILLDVIVWQRSELLFLGRLSNATQVSFYAVPFALTERVVDLIPGAVLGVLLPGLAFAQASPDPSRVSAVFGEALRYLALLTLPITIVGIVLAPFIIRVLYGPDFGGATIVLQILLVAVLFGVVGQASRSALLGMESQGRLLKTGVAAAALSIALDLILIPRWGAIGAAIANTAVQGTWALAIFIPLWRRLHHEPAPAIREVVAS